MRNEKGGDIYQLIHLYTIWSLCFHRAGFPATGYLNFGSNFIWNEALVKQLFSFTQAYTTHTSSMEPDCLK